MARRNTGSGFRRLRQAWLSATSKGARKIPPAHFNRLSPAIRMAVNLKALPFDGIVCTRKTSHLESLRSAGFDAIVLNDADQWTWSLRLIERTLTPDLLMIPADIRWVVPDWMRHDRNRNKLLSYPPVDYVSRSVLKGHFVEFGTFWGRSFFSSYFHFRHYLKGNFYSFDSFRGLPQPAEQEIEFTGGDFQTGSYFYNKPSLLLSAERLRVDSSRIKVIDGFYSESLKKSPESYGLAAKSVSVAVIDCDLFYSIWND